MNLVGDEVVSQCQKVGARLNLLHPSILPLSQPQRNITILPPTSYKYSSRSIRIQALSY